MLISEIESVLRAKSPLNKHQLLRELKVRGIENCNTSIINQVLYRNKNLFVHDGQSLPNWRLKAEGSIQQAQSFSPYHSLNISLYQGPPPRSWQLEALSTWTSHGKRGIVEAVTGTGKSLVGILAAADALKRGFKVLIVVPGIDLLKQWHDEITKYLPSVRVGKFGQGIQETFQTVELIVATVQSARKYQLLFPFMNGLIIADEIHRYGTEKSSMVFEDSFIERLGLTATYERLDNGLDLYVNQYFSPITSSFESEAIIQGCDFGRGLSDGILASFRVGLVATQLSDDEDTLYEKLDNSLRKLRNELIYDYNCQSEPFGEFIRDVQSLSKGPYHSPDNQLACKYLKQFKDRKDLLANSQYKLRAFKYLIPLIAKVNKCLVFTGFIRTAKEIERMLNDAKIPAVAFSSALEKKEREQYMNEFKTGKVKVLAAPSVLDEGIDVPEAELGIIMSANHSKRQMIQRLGRVIRPKKDGRPAIFFILYIQNTNEDPATGAQESFLNEMIEHAAEVRDFGDCRMADEFWDWYVQGKLGL